MSLNQRNGSEDRVDRIGSKDILVKLTGIADWFDIMSEITGVVEDDMRFLAWKPRSDSSINLDR